MIGAIIGDVIGSAYEHAGIKRTDFALFVSCPGSVPEALIACLETSSFEASPGATQPVAGPACAPRSAARSMMNSPTFSVVSRPRSWFPRTTGIA